MPEALIILAGQPMKVVCDGNCKKAWGINNRPKAQLSDDEDDLAFLADGELGEAPADPGTYEGRDAKPESAAKFPNKWCVRECERCALSALGEEHLPLAAKDFNNRKHNRHTGESSGMLEVGSQAWAEQVIECTRAMAECFKAVADCLIPAIRHIILALLQMELGFFLSSKCKNRIWQWVVWWIAWHAPMWILIRLPDKYFVMPDLVANIFDPGGEDAEEPD